MRVFIKKECYVCISLLNFTKRNGRVQATKGKILAAEYFVNSLCYL